MTLDQIPLVNESRIEIPKMPRLTLKTRCRNDSSTGDSEEARSHMERVRALRSSGYIVNDCDGLSKPGRERLFL